MTRVVKSVELPNHVKLPYSEQGDPLGAPLLLLHGFADSLRSFDLVLHQLPASIRAIALTQRGHGDASRPSKGYGVPDLAADLAAFMDVVQLKAAFIAGVSSGALIAQRFAIDHPERVLGLVLIGSPVTLRNKPEVTKAWSSTISTLSDPIDPGFVRGFVQSTVAQTIPVAFFETLVEESLKLPAHVWKAAFEGLLEDDSTEELHKIGAPTLVISGDKDALTWGDQETLVTSIENSRQVVYQGGGHMLIAEKPERIAADLLAFVESAMAC